MQKNIVTIIFVLMFFVLVWYVWKTTKPTTTTVAPATTPTGGTSTGNAPTTTPNTTPSGTPAPKPQPKPLDYTKQLKLTSPRMTGAEVSKLQSVLKSTGIKGADGKIISVDGVYGNNTNFAHEAVMKAFGTTDRSLGALSGTASVGNWGTVGTGTTSGGGGSNTTGYFSNVSGVYNWAQGYGIDWYDLIPGGGGINWLIN